MKILAVEDDATVLKWILNVLKIHEYKTLAATSAKEAISFLHANSSIGLIIYGIEIPHQDRYELLRYIKDNLRFNHIPVIIVSVLKDEAFVSKSLELGAKDYIVKPIKEQILLAKVEKILQGSLGTVLIVESDELVLNHLEKTIKRLNYNTISVKSAEEALELLGESKVNLIISEIMLPLMNGFDLLVEVKNKYPNIALAFIIENSGKFKKNHVIESGADMAIIKPFSNTQISRALKSLIR